MSRDLTMCFRNATGKLRTIRLEPWDRHFLLAPNEKVEIVASGNSEFPSIRVVEASDTTLIFTEGCEEVRVTQDGTTQTLLPLFEAGVLPVRPARRDGDLMWDRDLDGLV
ncbi:hypothetical protein V5E97_04235 [Singulisphaera sp. Ch08]|uniref:Uncharacterized protein n=1 Tax=Singulisphaera sp. Ch08 TaxID=3120278 RepID=A0AAU7CJA6_9BACT